MTVVNHLVSFEENVLFVDGLWGFSVTAEMWQCRSTWWYQWCW